MKDSFTHINNQDIHGALTTYGSIHYPPIPSPPHIHSPKRVFFCGVGRGNNDNGALKDIQGAFTSH